MKPTAATEISGPALSDLSVRLAGAAAYRPDIDGLRAFAVLPVVLFHFKIFPDYVGGGFVGVDIFFVISGYLITGIIFAGINKGTYSLIGFYDRRIRRIFPALISLYVLSIASAFLLNFPSEAETIGRSIIASTFFVSNIFFYGRSGYFDRDSETNPLLHTWSLSVEEQFYVLFPLVVFAIRQFSHRARVSAITIIALGSFLYAAYMVYANASAAFYLVQFRAWELAVGSLLAINALPKISHRWIAEVVGTLGMAMVCGSFVFLSRTLPFPGVAALAPCLGAAAIIYSGASHLTFVGRLLSLRPLQFVGLISYSLYLIHWPAIVFFRLFHEPSRIEKSSLVITCVVLATISWRFVEKPFRVRSHRLTPRGTLIAGGAAMSMVTIAALLLSPSMYLFWNYPTQALNVMAYAKIDESHMRVGTCFITAGYANQFEKHDKDSCLTVSKDRPNFLLIGDSHAAHLWSGLQTTYPSVNFLQATASGCRPVYGEGGEEHCTGMVRYIFNEFLPSNHLDAVIISARWDPKDLPELVSTVTAIRGYASRVIVVGPIVQYVQPLPRILARAIMAHNSEPEFVAQYRQPAQAETDRLFAAALKTEGIEYLSAYKSVCDPDCRLWAAPHVPLQFDDDHLTQQGSAYLAKKFGPALFPLW
jgi:peptidoglycan/LPS O-acetylase OafA/YrhL